MVVPKSSIKKGVKIWVPGDMDTWDLSVVVSRSGSTAKLEPANGGKTITLELSKEMRKKLFVANDAVVPDMTSLQYFHTPGILHNLKERATQDDPYTFLSQSVLVAVNPLKDIKDPKGLLGSPSAVNTPHPFAIAESAFQQLVFAARRGDGASETPVNQSIVIGGESGAGKTTCAKMVLRHLVARCASSGSHDDDLDNRLLESNPILEAFGNAVTKRNNNSSRFGKMLAVHYTRLKKGRDPTIFGASVTTYLLERSRVTFHVEGERTYHVFYQLVHGAGKSLRKRLELEGEFAFLKPRKENAGHGVGAASGKRNNKGGAQSRLPDPDADKANFKELQKALATIGLGGSGGGDDDGDEGGDAGDDLFKALAAILHLGNVKFKDKDSAEGSVASVEDEGPLKTAAKLLGLKHSKLLKLCTQISVKTVGDEVTKQRDARGAKYALDAVVKALYVGVFEHIVRVITKSLAEKGDLEGTPSVGVLDVFGFETFLVNDFEQLLINTCNEQLQSLFYMQVFHGEVALYKDEGLLLEDGDLQVPKSNERCVELLQGGGDVKGILPMIEAEARNPGAQDEKLLAALQREFKKHEYFPQVHPKDARSCFVVAHYAAQVKYTVGSFLEKNSDKLPPEVSATFKESKVGLVRKAFAALAESSEGAKEEGKKKHGKSGKAGGKSKGAPTSVAGKFKVQMEELMASLNETRCTFIRCVKPNASMKRSSKTEWFDNSYIVPQLINLSIPQTAEVLKGGLPTRVDFSMFTETYAALLPKDAVRVWQSLGGGDEKAFARALFHAYGIEPGAYKIGRTKVFFKSGMLDQVNQVLDAAVSGKKLNKAVARSFKEAFSHAVWRRLRAKLMVVGAFLRLLEDTREKHRAATIAARLAEQKMEEARAKAALKKEREEAAAAEAKAKAREAKAAKKRAKELKKELAAAATAEEAEKIELAMARATNRAEAADSAAKRLSVHNAAASRRDKALRASVRMMAAPEEFKRKSFRRSFAPARSAAASNAEEEDDGPLYIPDGVCFKVPRKPRGVGLPFAGFRGARAAAGAHRGGSGLGGLACISRLLGMGGGGPTDRDLGAHGRHDGSDVDSEAGGADADGWTECGLVLAGFQVRWYTNLERPGDGSRWEGKGVLKGTIQIDELTTMRLLDEDAAAPLVVSFGRGGYQADDVQLRFDDAMYLDDFTEAFESAKVRFRSEKNHALNFQRGALDFERNPHMVEYQQMLEARLISREDYELALLQQVTTDDQYLVDLVGRYGEDAYQDYKIQCQNCFEMLFNLPSEPLEECPKCGNKDLDSPQELAEEARQVRMRQEKMRDEAFDKGNLELRASFPFYLRTRFGKFVFQAPEGASTYSSAEGRMQFQIQMACQFQPARDAEWDDYVMSVTWEELRQFHADLAAKGSVLTAAQADVLPPFPRQDTAEDFNSDACLLRASEFLLRFLQVAQKYHYLEHDAILLFLAPGAPVPSR